MSNSTFLSSGDVLADRRFEWARDLEAKGDLDGAAGLLGQTLELKPDYAAAWFALAQIREKLGNRAGAIAAFRSAVAADRQDRHGAKQHLMRLGATPLAAMPESYVRTLFDAYASKFEAALTGRLGYRAPTLLLGAVQASGAPMTFGSVLDLGCGTGLAGVAFRPYCERLVGVDLSPAMLAQARAKEIYDRLVEGDIASFLAEEAAAQARHHVIVAADLFMYLPDLAPVLQAVAPVLAPGGMIAFNVETHDGAGVLLRETLRYAHGEDHVRAALAAAKLVPVSLDFASARSEKSEPVPGLICVARA